MPLLEPETLHARGTLQPALHIERLLPEYDAVRSEHLVVAGGLEQVFEATRRADFMQAWRESAAVRFSSPRALRASASRRGLGGVRFPSSPTSRACDWPT